MIRKSFRGKIFFYFTLVFVLFTVAVLTFQYEREKIYRTRQLEILHNITEITHRFINKYDLINNNETSRIGEIKEIIPQSHIRITLISLDGKVLYDSSVKDFLAMENHLHRPEIEKSMHLFQWLQHQKIGHNPRGILLLCKKISRLF